MAGRKPKPGRSIPVVFRLREGENDETLSRLRQLPKGQWSSYIRRVLAGAPVEVHDKALAEESAEVRAGLDALAGMWDDEE